LVKAEGHPNPSIRQILGLSSNDPASQTQHLDLSEGRLPKFLIGVTPAADALELDARINFSISNLHLHRLVPGNPRFDRARLPLDLQFHGLHLYFSRPGGWPA
jgi:hypothetical protein